VRDGEVVGILGPNGAGKTTTIHMLLNVLNPTSGSIEYFGKNLFIHRKEIMKQVAFGSAYTDLPGRLTVQENLKIFARLYGIFGKDFEERLSHYLSLFNLENFASKEYGSLSAGQKTRVMLAKTFLVQPKIILLDEPTASLDPDIAMEVRALITKQQKELGMTVILASHNMDEVASICNRVIVLSQGKIIDDNTPDYLASSIAKARVNIIVTAGIETAISYLQENNIAYKLHDKVLEITLDEQAIAHLLHELAKAHVHYSHISIEKPTLEDYFLEISRLSRKAPR
jgi:ABC-2 type transport system ATP-binding protein